MCRVKAKITAGPIKAEKVAHIRTISGEMAEVVVAASQTKRGSVVVAEIARDRDRVLVELPRESASGSWRLWVARRQVL